MFRKLDHNHLDHRKVLQKDRHLRNMDTPRRNVLASLFGDDTSNPDAWTRDHFLLDSHMHQLIQDAREDGDITEEDLSARVSNIAKRFPSIVEMGPDAGATDPMDNIEVEPAVSTSTTPSAPGKVSLWAPKGHTA